MTFNESDLIAYQLNELSPRRRRALQRALAADPALAAEAEAIAWTLRAFNHPPTPTVDAAVLDRNWQSLRPSLAALAPAGLSFWRRPLTLAAGLALAAAAVIGVAFFATHNTPVRTPTTATNSASPALPPTGNATVASSQAATGNQPSQPGFAHLATATQAPAASPARLAGNATADAHPSPQPASISNALARNDIASFPASSLAATRTAAPPQSRAAAPLAASITAAAPPLQASLTNSLPLRSSTQTLHTYSASNIVPPTPRIVHPHETSVSVGGFAALTPTSTATGTGSVNSQTYTSTTTQSIDPAAGVLVAFHEQLRPYAGYQLAAGYTRQALNTTTTASGYGPQSGLMLANAYEVSAAYVVRGPHARRLSTHAAAGGAALDFVPTGGTSSAHHVLRPAGLFTVGVDYRIHRRWSLRAEYRALFFKSPNLQNAASANVPVFTGYTVSSEPTISLNYRFDSMVRP